METDYNDQVIEDWKGKVTEDQLLDALSYALSELKIDPKISRIRESINA